MRTRALREDDGFTLMELLVVAVIIGILAAISIPTFLSQRQKAWARAVQSDLRNAAIAAEEYFNDNLTYAGFDSSMVRASDGDVVSVTAADVNGYCLEADHANLPDTPDYHFSLALGRPVAGPCAP